LLRDEEREDFRADFCAMVKDSSEGPQVNNGRGRGRVPPIVLAYNFEKII
jgi:hypothetical protein